MRILTFTAALSMATLASVGAPAATLTTLYTFSGGADGSNPGAALVPDGRGGFFGTTEGGGANASGTVFHLLPPAVDGAPYTLASLYSFAAGTDGAVPTNLVRDGAGNLYGVSNRGGGGTSDACVRSGTAVGCGVVYQLEPPAADGDTWHETVLHAFSGNADGYAPSGLTIFEGRLYGFSWGGNGSCDGGCGTVYELTPPAPGTHQWTYKRLHTFSGAHAAHGPFGNPLVDAEGALYGIAYSGGATAPTGCAPFVGCGEVFRLAPPEGGTGAWSKSTLWNFNGLDGTGGFNSLSMDADGNLYGMTNEGGNSSDDCPPPDGSPAGCGVAFELERPAFGTDKWTQRILWNFTGGADGGYPANSALAMQRNGNLLATTSGTVLDGPGLYGAIVQLVRPAGSRTAWRERTLHSFTNGDDGAVPVGTVVMQDGQGYGTTFGFTGVAAAGTIYRIAP